MGATESDAAQKRLEGSGFRVVGVGGGVWLRFFPEGLKVLRLRVLRAQ